MVVVRQLEERDLDASWHLGRLAFGWNTDTRTPPPINVRDDDPFTRWGAFDDDDRLVGKAIDLHHEQWWGGRLLPACDVAGVAVEPEHRGGGITRAVLTRLLDAGRERGAVVANLFCTSTAVYRSLGFEVGGVMRTVDIPTATLPRRRADTITLRPATGRDWPDVRGVYDAVSAAGNGYLSRRGRLFPEPDDDALPDGIDGVTLATDATGQVVGYASWERGKGYHDDSVLTVPDCLALSPDAANALLTSIASWGTVAPTVRFRLSATQDVVGLRLPLERAREHRTEVWMHRPLDVAAAVAARDWPGVADGTVTFRLVDRLVAANDGTWQLSLEDGKAALVPATGDADVVLDVRGWSLLWCGAARTPQLRHAGLLTGPEKEARALDALLASSGPSGLLDYF